MHKWSPISHHVCRLSGCEGIYHCGSIRVIRKRPSVRQETSLPALLYSVASGGQEIIHPDFRISLQGTCVPEIISTALSAWWQRASDSLKSLLQSDATELLYSALQNFLSVPKTEKSNDHH